ncbi:MAG: lipopolysaccharide transport periplasmic protein LptA [Pseudomonadaceae bacterium]|nr:lipopolysaccharide transport periplasmic protein LptA [Pseudomonadaceae bacterium]
MSLCQRAFAVLAIIIAAALSVTASALPDDAGKPIHIRGDNAEFDQNNGLLIYTGAVRIDQGTLRVTADRMVVEYRDDQVVKITAEGTPASYQQQLEADEGLVNADAKTIVYHTTSEKVDLIGEAFLTQEGNEFQGSVIRYNIRQGRVDAESKSDAPVRMMLQPAPVERSVNGG